MSQVGTITSIVFLNIYYNNLMFLNNDRVDENMCNCNESMRSGFERMTSHVKSVIDR